MASRSCPNRSAGWIKPKPAKQNFASSNGVLFSNFLRSKSFVHRHYNVWCTCLFHDLAHWKLNCATLPFLNRTKKKEDKEGDKKRRILHIPPSLHSCSKQDAKAKIFGRVRLVRKQCDVIIKVNITSIRVLTHPEKIFDLFVTELPLVLC